MTGVRACMHTCMRVHNRAGAKAHTVLLRMRKDPLDVWQMRLEHAPDLRPAVSTIPEAWSTVMCVSACISACVSASR